MTAMSAPNDITGDNKPTLFFTNDLKKKLDLHSSSASDDDRKSTPPLVTLQSNTSTLSTPESLAPCSFPSSQPIDSKISAEDREQMARDYITQRGFTFTYDDLDPNGQLRANRLMSHDRGWSPIKGETVGKGVSLCREHTTFKREFNSFCSSFSEGPAWRSRVFFDESAMDDYLVIRRQKGGFCYMNASIIFQHYLQCKRTTGPKDHTMLDLSTYIRDSMTNDEVAQYLQKCGSGGSDIFYSGITGIPSRSLISISFAAPQSENPDNFNLAITYAWGIYENQREPGLVSGFHIESAFVDEENSVFDYEVEEAALYSYARSKGRTMPIRHSMVLIGVHRVEEETGKVWFLLQNFWRNRYFCIVSAEYLASCHATISFVASQDNVSLNGSHPTVDALYVETDLELEECEEYLLEEEGGFFVEEEREWADY